MGGFSDSGCLENKNRESRLKKTILACAKLANLMLGCSGRLHGCCYTVPKVFGIFLHIAIQLLRCSECFAHGYMISKVFWLAALLLRYSEWLLGLCFVVVLVNTKVVGC